MSQRIAMITAEGGKHINISASKAGVEISIEGPGDEGTRVTLDPACADALSGVLIPAAHTALRMRKRG